MEYTGKTNFELLERIGGDEGANSYVYLARDKQLNSDFIVKIVPKTSFTNEDEYFHESRVIYENKHPSVVEIQYAAYDDDNVFFFMPYYERGSINSIINERFLTNREIIKYSLDFLSGVHYIHTNKLLHTDIKPTNILINNNGKAVITDFGLSKYVNMYGVALTNKMYHTHYTPEVINNRGVVTVKTDIYQSGLTLYRMCNGNDLFKQQADKLFSCKEDIIEKAILEEKFPDRNLFLPHIPNKMRKIIKKALSTDNNKGYNSIIEMINDISNVEENLDWTYELKDNREIWKIKNSGQNIEDRIELILEGDTYNIIGKKANLLKASETNINKWNVKSLKSKDDAYKKIEKFIKEYK